MGADSTMGVALPTCSSFSGFKPAALHPDQTGNDYACGIKIVW